jgi:FkbM family methyltransferase
MKKSIKAVLIKSLPKWLLFKITVRGLKKSAEKKEINVSITHDYVRFIKGNRVIQIALKHFIYSADMVNSFDYYYGAVRPLEIDGISLVDYATPRYHEMNGFDLMPVFFPSLSEPIITTNQYLDFADLQPGSVVLDLGAYSGLTSIIFKELVGKSGKVIGLDADKINFNAIERNLSLYKNLTGNDIEVIFGAAWNHCEGLNFSTEGNMGSSATEIVGELRGQNRLVESYTLSRLAEIFELERVQFIKCDIEGAEAVIFEDSAFFEKYSPRIIIETHVVGNEETTDKCIADLSKYGYKCKRIEQSGVVLPLLECYPPAMTIGDKNNELSKKVPSL